MHVGLIVKEDKVLNLKGTYTLSRGEIQLVYNWFSKLKFPDGYVSNITNCVNTEQNVGFNPKSHDYVKCHSQKYCLWYFGM